jgi:hypothetical protein
MNNPSISPLNSYKRGFIEIYKSTTKGHFIRTFGQNFESGLCSKVIPVHLFRTEVDRSGQATSFGLSLLG